MYIYFSILLLVTLPECYKISSMYVQDVHNVSLHTFITPPAYNFTPESEKNQSISWGYICIIHIWTFLIIVLNNNYRLTNSLFTVVTCPNSLCLDVNLLIHWMKRHRKSLAIILLSSTKYMTLGWGHVGVRRMGKGERGQEMSIIIILQRLVLASPPYYNIIILI